MPKPLKPSKPASTPAAPKAAAPRQTDTTPEQPVKYPSVRVEQHAGAKALTLAKSKDLLGWESETEDAKFDHNYLLVDEDGNKVRCHNNTTNRPLSKSWALTLAKSILYRHWQYNLETIIVSRTGMVLSGQHRLVGHALACQIWASADPDTPWRRNWPEEPTLETLVAYGADETPELLRTLDNVKPRTLADVLFSDASIFGKRSKKERRVLCRAVDFAVRLLWERTGAKSAGDAFAPRRTHSESLDFIARHPYVLAAVKHVVDEYGDGPAWKVNQRRLGVGYAAGLLYLMATSNSDGEAYRAMPLSRESSGKKAAVNFVNRDLAEAYWSLLCQGGAELRAVRFALDALGESGPLNERLAILCKGWRVLVAAPTATVSSAAMKLKRHTNDDGSTMLVDPPTTGGLDLGEAKDEDMAEAAPTVPKTKKSKMAVATGPAPEEVQPNRVQYDADGKPPAPKFRGTKAAAPESVQDVDTDTAPELNEEVTAEGDEPEPADPADHADEADSEDMDAPDHDGEDGAADSDDVSADEDTGPGPADMVALNHADGVYWAVGDDIDKVVNATGLEPATDEDGNLTSVAFADADAEDYLGALDEAGLVVKIAEVGVNDEAAQVHGEAHEVTEATDTAPTAVPAPGAERNTKRRRKANRTTNGQ